MYSYNIGWFPQKTTFKTFAIQAQKGKGVITMSIEKWLEQYGTDEEMTEEGELVSEPVEETEEPEADEPEDDVQDDYEEEEEFVEEEPKQVQSREANARFAEQRRQQQLEQQLQDRLHQSKEFQTTQLLAEMYGVPQDELYDKLYEAKLSREAQEQNVPVEYLKEREQLRQQQQSLQEQLNSLMFQQWQGRVDTEKAQLKSQFNMLTDDDLESAAYYMLNDLKRTDLPLENAVFALHGAKILGGLKNTAKNEALAEVSGRKKSPLPVKGGKTQTDSVSLSDEERYVAKKFGLTDKEYYKWKEGN
jgi:hypothetical protein